MNEQTVLLVDDDTSFLENMKKGLEYSIKNLKMITHTNAEDACKYLTKKHVSLLITDQNLPGMSGVELVNFVDKNYPRIPIILITAYGTPKLKNHAINTGAIKFLRHLLPPPEGWCWLKYCKYWKILICRLTSLTVDLTFTSLWKRLNLP